MRLLANRIHEHQVDKILHGLDSVADLHQLRAARESSRLWSLGFTGAIPRFALSFTVATFTFAFAGTFADSFALLATFGEFYNFEEQFQGSSLESSIETILKIASLGILIFTTAPLSALSKRNGEDQSVPLDRAERCLRSAVTLYAHAAVCGRTLEASGANRVALSREVKCTGKVEREIRHAWRTTRSAKSVSALPRYQKLSEKRHAAVVIAAVRSHALRIDSQPDEALRELGFLLATVATRCAEGRTGALATEEQLRECEPQTSHEVLRLITVSLVVGTAAVGAALLPIPQAAFGTVVSVVGVLIVALVYRRRAAQGIDILGVMGGGR